ncbi:hypothetical protein Bbelb_377900 [Branchiostoma belcheri]|nr:hypothetical protein Bbelb_377900 [Branchiostoma belcheri]
MTRSVVEVYRPTSTTAFRQGRKHGAETGVPGGELQGFSLTSLVKALLVRRLVLWLYEAPLPAMVGTPSDMTPRAPRLPTAGVQDAGQQGVRPAAPQQQGIRPPAPYSAVCDNRSSRFRRRQ